MQKLLNLRYNIILALCFFCATASSHLAYVYLRMNGVDSVKFENYIGLFVVLFIFSFIRQNFWRFLSMGLVLLLSFFQFVHLEFYGVPVFPAEIYLLFSQFGEITGTITQDYEIFYIPTLITILPAIILWQINKRVQPKVASKYLYFLFIFYFIYNPARTYITGNTWGRQPSGEEFEGTNIYLATSYFLGRILPAKLKANSYDSNHKSLEFKKINEFDHNIIFILGESLTPNHMSLFGYQRETTPFLNSVKEDSKFSYSYAISSGVSSDVSVAFLMNNTYGPTAARDVYSGKQCLFNLAKQAGFNTTYYSTQSKQQLRYIANSLCPKFVDDYKFLEELSPNEPDHDAANDNILIDYLKKMDLERGKQFVVLHQRGSHGPYNKRFSPQADVFKIKDNAGRTRNNMNYYDNSVVQFDIFMNKIISYVKTIKKPTYIIYVSDHGEGLGEEGVYGHGKLNRISYQVPFLQYVNFEKNFQFPDKITHLNISLWVVELLGFKADKNALDQLKNYIVFGNDMDGFMGYMDLDLTKTPETIKNVGGK